MRSKSAAILRHKRNAKRITLLPPALRSLPLALRQRIMLAALDRVVNEHARTLMQPQHVHAVVMPPEFMAMMGLAGDDDGPDMADAHEVTRH